MLNEQKSIFGKKMTKVALGLRTWVAACIRGPKYVNTGIFLCMQLGFQKYKKDKFFTIMAEVWNESHIVYEPLQTHFFNCKKPYMIHFQNTQKSHGKNLRFTRK